MLVFYVTDDKTVKQRNARESFLIESNGPALTMTHIYLCLRDTIIMGLDIIRDHSVIQTSLDKKPQAEVSRLS